MIRVSYVPYFVILNGIDDDYVSVSPENLHPCSPTFLVGVGSLQEPKGAA